MLSKLQSQSRLLGHFAVQWRFQGRGPGDPGCLLIFKPNWGPRGREKRFFRPPPLISGSGLPPPPRSPPYLKVWIRHCRLLALPMLVCKIWRVNCDKQHWKDEETGQKLKKQRWVDVSQLSLPETGSRYDSRLWQRKVKLYYRVFGCYCLMIMNDNSVYWDS